MNSLSSAPAAGQPSKTTLTKAETLQAICNTIRLLAVPGQAVELRIPGLNGKRIDSGYFNDPMKLAQAAFKYEGCAEGIYVTLNPVNPALLARGNNRMKEYARHTTADKDVLQRRWIFVDFDPIRPAGISSSNDELLTAQERAVAAQQWLTERQICSVLCNSGNGTHLLIPVDLPNDEASTELVKGILSILDTQFTDEQVKVDTSTLGAGHLVKLYGTMACKGDNIPDRPHRRSAILTVPQDLAPVDRAVLEALIQVPMHPRDEGDKKTDGRDRSLVDEMKTRFDMVAYAEHSLGVAAVKQGEEYRLPGNNGFLINPTKGCWYRHGSQEGGDALDLVGHLLYGSSWNKHNPEQFKHVLREVADLSGIALPVYSQGRGENEFPEANTAVLPFTEQAPKADLLDVAQAWQKQYAEDLAWDAGAQTWRRWTGTHWQEEHEPESLDLMTAHIMRQMGVPVSSGNKANGVIRFARALCKQRFDLAAGRVNFQNGTLDLSTLSLQGHDRADGLTECIPYAYTPEDHYSRIQKFLQEAIPDPAGQQAYMTHVGMALLGDTTLHKALVIIGPSRSGKTTLLKLAQLTLGYRPGQFATSIVFSAESRGANSRATWIDHTPRLVCLDEFPEEALRDEGEELFKSMTAHGGVSMWLKYRDERSENLWQPKLMFATNNRMRYRDQSGALTRRLVVIECPNSLSDYRLDGALLHKLTPELGAFAATCIRLALDAQTRRSYPESDAMRNLLTDIETNGDAAKLWLAENCIYDPHAFESIQALYANFRIWCGENGLYPVSRPKLKDAIIGFWPGILSTKRRVFDAETGENKPLWGLAGIRLRRDDDPDEDLPDSRSIVPERSKNETCHESSHTAECSGVPSDSENYSAIQTDSPDFQIVKERKFLPDLWNTGTIPDTEPNSRGMRVGTSDVESEGSGFIEANDNWAEIRDDFTNRRNSPEQPQARVSDSFTGIAAPYLPFTIPVIRSPWLPQYGVTNRQGVHSDGLPDR